MRNYNSYEQKEASETVGGARDIMKGGDFQRGAEILKRYVAEHNHDDNREAYFLLAVCLYANYEYKEAFTYIQIIKMTYGRITRAENDWFDKIKEKANK